MKTSLKGWRAEGGMTYYYVDWAGRAEEMYETFDVSDNWCHKTGNYFKTKQDAQEYKEYLEALAAIREFRERENGDWKVDEEDLVFYPHLRGEWGWSYDQGVAGIIWGLYPNTETVEKLIKEHEKELNIIRDYLIKHN